MSSTTLLTQAQREKRWNRTLKMREIQKKTFPEIGDILGVTSVTARGIYKQAKVFQEGQLHPLYGSPKRLKVTFDVLGIHDKNSAIAAIQAGKFNKSNPANTHMQGVGDATIRALYKWCELPPPRIV
jgi:hypothetical protein